VGALVERFRQPVVLGEILVGVILGNLVFFGVDFLAPVSTDVIVGFLAQLGAVILLFQIGLESNVRSMRQCDGQFAAGAPHVEFAFSFVRSTPERWFEFRW